MLQFRKLLSMSLLLGLAVGVGFSQTPLEKHGALSVKNQTLTGADGNPAVLRGMSLFDTTSYGQYVSTGVLEQLRDEWKTSVFRVAMYTSYNGKFIGKDAFKYTLDQIGLALDSGMYVLADWHILTDGNPLNYKAEAIDFFTQVATRFGSRPNLLYEICNEPNGSGVDWPNAIKPYALEVIPAIRAIDPDNVIIVGTPNWSQEILAAAADPLPFDNLMYTMHLYAGTHDVDAFLQRIDQARAQGIAIFVTEWGTTTAKVTGGMYVAPSLRWTKGLAERNVSWANWSLSSKLEGTSIIRPNASIMGGWKPGDLSDSGQLIRTILRGDQETYLLADSFESGNFKAGEWVRENVMIDREVKKTGEIAARFEKGTSLKRVVNASLAKNMVLTSQYKGAGSSADKLIFEYESAPGTWKKLTEVTGKSKNWETMTLQLPFETAETSTLTIRIRAQIAGKNAIWLDDIEITALR